MKVTSYQLNSSEAARQDHPREAPVPPSTLEPPPPLSLRVLTARRLLDLVALGIAPAAAAGLLAFGHTGHPPWGVVVALSVLVVNQLVSQTRYPLHLMPVTRLVICGLTPLLGVLLAWVAASSLGTGSVGGSLIPAVAGAFLIATLGYWVKGHFDRRVAVRIAVIGDPEVAQGLSTEIAMAEIRGYEFAGWISVGGQPPPDLAPGVVHLGSIEKLRQIVATRGIELLVHAQGPSGEVSRLDIFEGVGAACLDLPVRLIEASQFYEELLGHVPAGQINAAWFQYLMHPRYRRTPPVSKRLFDLVVGGAALIVAAPLIALFAIAIKLSDRGPAFYRQRRVGEGGKEFEMVKLRSMRPDSQAGGAQWSSRDDDRVLPVGQLMRKLHLDELPQLWNVLRGDMTLVGPRPEQPELVSELERRFPHYERRQLVKPGITGWAQVRCGYAGTKEGSAWKLCHDLYYLKHRSLLADVMIICETLRTFGHRAQFDLEPPGEQFILDEPAPVVGAPAPVFAAEVPAAAEGSAVTASEPAALASSLCG
jgi:exopolysaccharide biosynthesis polyprenyl glycosylphosphotransferase